MLTNKTVVVNRPVEEVYQFWQNVENFPRFMIHLKDVRSTGSGRSHWVAMGPGGKLLFHLFAAPPRFDRGLFFAGEAFVEFLTRVLQPGQFLLKDVVLLGVALLTAGEALAAARPREPVTAAPRAAL